MKNRFLVLLTAFLWISCGSVGDIASVALGGDVGATTTDTSTTTATSDSETISSTGSTDTITDSSDSSESSDSSDSTAGDNSATSDGVGVSDSGDITVDTSSDSITDSIEIDTTIDTDSSNSPVVFVPLPEEDGGTTTTVASLTLSSSFLMTSQDSDDEAVAQADADSFEASSTVSITNASYGQRLNAARERLAFLQPVQNFAQEYLPGFMSSFLDAMIRRDGLPRPSTPWDHPSANFIPPAFADSGLCIADSEGEVIAEINADGSLDATPIPDYHTGDVVAVAYCDPATGTLGTADNASALTRVVYLGDTPSSSAKIASSNGDLFMLDADGNIMEMNYDATDDRFTMDASVGGFDEGYALADAGTPDELDLDTTNSGYVFRESGVVSAYTLDSSSHSFTELIGSSTFGCNSTTGVCSSTYVCSSASGCSANNVKVKSGKVYFSTEWTSAQSLGKIRELYDDTSNGIRFLSSSDSYTNATTGTSESGIQLSAIKAFDVVEDAATGSWSEHLTVFEAGDGRKWLFGRTYGELNDTVAFTLPGVTTVRDLIIYNAADHVGSAALLYDHRLQLYTYDLNQVTCEEEDTTCTASTAAITRGAATIFTADENPVAVAVNEAGTMAFVLNQGSDTESYDDDYITVVDLSSGGRQGGLGTTLDPDSDGRLELSTFLGDKILTDFSPTSIHSFTVGDDTYLFVGADHMNLGIVIGPF